MFFRKKIFILLVIFFTTVTVSGCKDRIHESWKEKPAAPVYDDPIISARINGAIQDDPMLQGLKINIEVNDGFVTLSGEANNQAQADQAALHSWRVDGVKDVDNQISLRH